MLQNENMIRNIKEFFEDIFFTTSSSKTREKCEKSLLTTYFDEKNVFQKSFVLYTVSSFLFF